MTTEKDREMVEAHAEWFAGVLERELDHKIIIYKEAMLHGLKHGREE